MTRIVGLLGGSFNPAHHGHVAISNHIRKTVGLDEIWWIVTPQNRLKTTYKKNNLQQRINQCTEITEPHTHIEVMVDPSPPPHHTIDTITIFQQLYRDTKFVWMMGADNLATFHQWEHWQKIANTIPMVIYDRPSYTHTALSSKCAHFFSHAQLDTKDATLLPLATAPAWTFLRLKTYDISSTQIRREQ